MLRNGLLINQRSIPPVNQVPSSAPELFHTSTAGLKSVFLAFFHDEAIGADQHNLVHQLKMANRIPTGTDHVFRCFVSPPQKLAVFIPEF